MRYLKDSRVLWFIVGGVVITLIVLAMQLNQINSKKKELEGEKLRLNNKILNLEEENEKIIGKLGEKINDFNKAVKKNSELDQEIKEKDEIIKEKEQELKNKEQELEKKNSEIKRLKIAETKISGEGATSGNRTRSSTGKVFSALATHYSAFCPTGCTGVTATGVDVSNSIYYKGKRVVAVDPNVIPLNSLVRVTGNGYDFEAYAIDTGGDIKGSGRIDILVNSTEEAYKFGKKNVKVEIIN